MAQSHRLLPAWRRTVASTVRILRGPDWAGRLLARLDRPPADVAAWMEKHTGMLKRDAHSRVGLLELEGQSCYLKLYLAKSRWQRLGFQLGRGRGVHSFDAAAAIARHGLPVPEPRCCLLVSEGMLLLTEGMPGGRDLRSLWPGQPPAVEPELLMRTAGDILAALHGAGFAHGDCKWGNLLWDRGRFYLVDLEAVRKVNALTPGTGQMHGRQLRDLARFTLEAEESGVSPELYSVFIDSYLGHSGQPRSPVIAGMKPPLEILRRRHLARYGIEGRHLV